MRGQYCPFRDVTRTRKLRNDNDKTKISNGSIESLICSQDPAGCLDDGGTGGTCGNGGNGGNGGSGGITTIDNSTGIYDALAGSYSAIGTASLT